MPHDGQTQGPRGFPNILGLLRGTNLKVLGKAGATAGAGLAGGTTSGAPTSGSFDVGEAVIGADGTLFVCTVAGSPGTWVQLGTLVDPLTTRGDLIVRGASATTRLALGTTNYVLTSNGTDAVWSVAPAGAGGALTQIAQTVLSSSAASVTFSSIPGTYSSLLLLYQATGTNAAAQAVQMQLNGDTAANYDYDGLFWSGISGATSIGSAYAATAANVSAVSGSGAPAGSACGGRIEIPNYAGTTFHKFWTAMDFRRDASSGTNLFGEVYGGDWRSTSAITSLLLKPAAGSYASGSTFTLYGLS